MGEKSHKCQTRKRNKRAINMHMYSLKLAKEHKCKACDKIFSQAGNQQAHVLTHTVVKSHKCDACNKTFSQPDTYTHTHTQVMVMVGSQVKRSQGNRLYQQYYLQRVHT